jgi:hypothetical protein
MNINTISMYSTLLKSTTKVLKRSVLAVPCDSLSERKERVRGLGEKARVKVVKQGAEPQNQLAPPLKR